MADVKKRTNQILAIGALGLGTYALLKSSGILGDSASEGSIGGSEDQFSEDQGFRNIAADPNTIPEQPLQTVQDYTYTVPQDYIIPPQGGGSSNVLEPTVTPISTADSGAATALDTGSSGLFGTGITAGEYALGFGGFLPSAFTKFGENLYKNTDNILKRTIPEAVEETPFIGKKLKDFAFNEADDVVTSGLTKPTANLLQQSTEGALKFGTSEIVEVGAKDTLKTIGKKTGKAVVGAVPFIGTAAGAEFDVAVDKRSRPVAYVANALGDVVGGILGAVTSPLALTGVGAAVPVVVTVGGQIATESLVYGVADTLSGKGRVDQQAVDTALALQNQGTTTANIPVSNSYTFNLSDSGKSYLKAEEEDKSQKSFFDIFSVGNTARSAAVSSASSSPVLSSTSKGGISKNTKSDVKPTSSSGGGSSSKRSSSKSSSSKKVDLLGTKNVITGKVSYMSSAPTKKVDLSNKSRTSNTVKKNKLTKALGW